MKRIYVYTLISFLILTSVIKGQWIYQQTPSNGSYYLTVDLVNIQAGAVGGANVNLPSFSGIAAYTTNGGINWLNASLPDSTRVMIEIRFVNASTGFCAGAYNLSASKNSGNRDNYNRKTLQKLRDAPDGNNEYKGLFLKTTNSGQNWNAHGTLPQNVYYMLGINFVNEFTGYAIASLHPDGNVNDGVLKTTNGGLTWQTLTLPENINILEDIHFLDLNTGFVVGSDVVSDSNRAVILKTTNGGSNWVRTIFMQHYAFSGIHFSNSSTGISVTNIEPLFGSIQTQIYRTTDGGINWLPGINLPNVLAEGVKFVNSSSTVIIHGSNSFGFDFEGYLAVSTNSGNSWSGNQLRDTGLVIFDLKLLSGANWYASGGNLYENLNPEILHTTNGGGAIGILQISHEIPKQYGISQNYPNPFNPATKIRFAVPKAGNVKLMVYDMLGKEVSNLVNSQLSAGKYEVTFDAAKLPSGIYFYRVIAGEFTQTKRMTLIK